MTLSVDKSAHARPQSWGGGRDMNGVEAVMWRAETDRVIRSPLLALEQLDSEPDFDKLRACHEWALRVAPRLRQRVVEAPLGLGAPRWSDDPHFDLRMHLWQTRLPEGSGWAGLMEAASRLAMRPFDRTRPPWEAVLYTGLPDGRAAYLLKIHHSVTDGLGAVQLLNELHSRAREKHPGDEMPIPFPARRDSSTSLDVLTDQVRRDVGAVPGVLREVGSAMVGALSNPGRAVRVAARYGQSLHRVVSSWDGASSPLLAQRGVAWRFAALDLPVRDLRAAARAGRGTLHDAYIAALLGGYRRYHRELGVRLDGMPVGIPVSKRRRDDPAGGNRFLAVRINAPVGIADPRERIAQVRELVSTARAEPAMDAMGLMTEAMARLPGAVSTQLMASMAKSNDLQASFVPGPREHRYLAGAHIERVYPYAPLPGCPAMITLVTHREVGCVGVNFDLAAFTEPDLFVRCLAEGFGEVLSLHPGAGEPIVRA
ncbi:MAG TPA: wax ester/triacylglycerol synthase domain-containing protein [Pseudonocardia sp.]|jgi:WS/DGAT/MGAT family acyltransferase|nr:wax ester/triacylglycerol synthase domain-containing protein [Pseudonocardia sp.]